MAMVMDDYACPTFTTSTYYSPPPPVYYPPESQFFPQYPPYQPYYPPQSPYYPPQNEPYAPPSQPPPNQPYYPPPSPYFSPQPSPYDPPSPYYPPSNQPYYPPPQEPYCPPSPPPYYPPPQYPPQQAPQPQQEPFTLPNPPAVLALPAHQPQDPLAAVLLRQENQEATMKRLETALGQISGTLNQIQQIAQPGKFPAQGLQLHQDQVVTVLRSEKTVDNGVEIPEFGMHRNPNPVAAVPLRLQAEIEGQPMQLQSLIESEEDIVKDDLKFQLHKASKSYVPPIPFPSRLRKEKQVHELVGNLQYKPKRSDPKSFEFDVVLDSGEKVLGLMDLGAVVNLRPHSNFEKMSSKNLKVTDIRIEEESLLEGIDHEMFDVESQISVREMGDDDELILDFGADEEEKPRVRSRTFNGFFEVTTANRDTSLATTGIG